MYAGVCLFHEFTDRVFFLFITSSKYTGNIFREIIVYLCVETDNPYSAQDFKSCIPQAKQNFGNRPKVYLGLVLLFYEVYLMEELILQKYTSVFPICVGYHSSQSETMVWILTNPCKLLQFCN